MARPHLPADFPLPERLQRMRRRRFWNARAEELIEAYDHPETWASRGWMDGDDEERLVLDILRSVDARSVFVVGAGSGRQYTYLVPHRYALGGVELAPRLAEECRRRFPSIATIRGDVARLANVGPYDAVLSSATLQHVPPSDIAAALDALQRIAGKVIVLRELAVLPSAEGLTYKWARDYESLLPGWRTIHAETTDAGDDWRVDLTAFARDDA